MFRNKIVEGLQETISLHVRFEVPYVWKIINVGFLHQDNDPLNTFGMRLCGCTVFPAYSETLGTWEKCHCIQIVTVTRGI